MDLASDRSVAESKSQVMKPKELSGDQVAEVFRRLAKERAVSSGELSASHVSVVWSQRDVIRKAKVQHRLIHPLLLGKDEHGEPAYKSMGTHFVEVDSTTQWNVPSPSEKLRVIVSKKKDDKSEEKQFLSIASNCGIEKVFDLKALDKHGNIVSNDGQFGSMQWSPCEKYLLYVAEKKKPKTSGFFEIKPVTNDRGDTATEATVKGEEYVYRESWGEQLVERHQTVIYRLHIETGDITELTAVPQDYSPGQAVWGPNNKVVFVGWCHEPYRLGLRFCVERKSALFVASFDEEDCEQLSEDGRAVRCPSFSPDLSRLVYLDTPEGGPHNQCSRLMMIDWKKVETKEPSRSVLVDIVHSPYKSGYNPEKDEFPGLFTWADLGCGRNWLGDNVHVLIPTFWRSSSAIVIINTNSRLIHRLFPFDSYPFRSSGVRPFKRSLTGHQDVNSEETSQPVSEDGLAWSCTLLDVRENDVLIACSWPDRPPRVAVCSLYTDSSKASKWLGLGDFSEQGSKVPEFDWHLLILDPKDSKAQHPQFDYLKYEALLYLPAGDGSKDTKPPLVLFPHGGPHSAFDSSFTLHPAVLATCGFACLCVNFRGSLGFGQDNIDSLLGHVGDFDVKDCMLAVERVRQEKLVDPDNTFVYGGSHGGFLAAHLIGQYPDEFRAASMRNPVTNLTSMVGTTDIHDWPFVEAGLQFNDKSLATPDVLEKLWKASPISHIDKVKTPVMLNIGLKDMRVPNSQGLEYYKCLKARNVPVKCLTYPESNHSLSEVEVEADSLINSILWFSQCICEKTSS